MTIPALDYPLSTRLKICGPVWRICGEKHRDTVAPPCDYVVNNTSPRPYPIDVDFHPLPLSNKGMNLPVATIPHQCRSPPASCFPIHPHLSVALRRLGACGSGGGRARAGLWGGLTRRVVRDEAAMPWSRTSPAPCLRQPPKWHEEEEEAGGQEDLEGQEEERR